MQVLTIKKWGNSLGVRIPKNIAEHSKLKVDQEVNIEVRKGNIIITPVASAKEYSLQELLDQCPEESLVLDDEDRAWLQDQPVGKEIL
ncbi:AbrB/MazE/SpoVT family DNA-binding domain-containing protein [Desulfobulbus alkaliphilus]|uniref:AbrB/MazE/SpoVT family DNA-binding domain-containing protein n=1 Tax=Desulfobulbus alkaliphilus TaxID=869814 RepID=UPI0019649A48|nr:AbrB/MazE/SpoVT family DNA-binding domain-containing protein [Desulfobulbus alkaliphilus]MBM9537090.1 AbrB/MazE/SpoVT family DNA-binding domain-containing protein [Desulfobulbus alkaliphilus]